MFVVYEKIPNQITREGKQVFRRRGGKYTGLPSAAARKAIIRKHVRHTPEDADGLQTFYLRKTGTDQFYEFRGQLGKVLPKPITRTRKDGTTWTITRGAPDVYCIQVVQGGSYRTST